MSIPKYNVATPYTAAYALLRRGDQVAMVLREHTGWKDGHYGLPSGKVEHGESFTQAVIREANEEVGVTIDPENVRHALTMHRDASRDDSTVWVDVYFEVSKWEGEVVNAEPDKHSKVEWLDINNLPENVVPSVRVALEAIAAGKSYIEFGWGA